MKFRLSPRCISSCSKRKKNNEEAPKFVQNSTKTILFSRQELITRLHQVERQIQACENSLREEKEKRRKYYVSLFLANLTVTTKSVIIPYEMRDFEV